MTRFEARPGLDEEVAMRIALPTVRRMAAHVRDRAQRNAPDAKVWVTAHDERVRPSHEHADGQEVPDNLRYLVPKVGVDTSQPIAAGNYDQARKPRDPTLPFLNRVECRCESVPLRGIIARAIHMEDAHALGARVSARVSVKFPRIVESEHPSEPDRGGGWFLSAVKDAAATLPGRGNA
jgi:hypothetical protein